MIVTLNSFSYLEQIFLIHGTSRLQSAHAHPKERGSHFIDPLSAFENGLHKTRPTCADVDTILTRAAKTGLRVKILARLPRHAPRGIQGRV